MIYHCEQNSAEWNKMRCGRITAGRTADALSRLKNGSESAKRYDYRMDLVAERLTGMTEPDRNRGPEVRWGKEWEPIARSVYEVRTGAMVDRVGFVTHPAMDYFGGSPDALVGKDGGVELKCPKSTTHLEWIEAGVVPEEHVAQCLANMACAERKWWDFASYDPRFPDPGLRLFIVRMERDEKCIEAIEREVQKFNAEVDYAIEKIQESAHGWAGSNGQHKDGRGYQ